MEHTLGLDDASEAQLVLDDLFRQPLYTAADLDESPSRQAGVSEEDETACRQAYVGMIWEVAQRLLMCAAAILTHAMLCAPGAALQPLGPHSGRLAESNCGIHHHLAALTLLHSRKATHQALCADLLGRQQLQRSTATISSPLCPCLPTTCSCAPPHFKRMQQCAAQCPSALR
jgi:hypothetical protein